MNLSTWNIRGLNDPFKQSEIYKLIINMKISFIGIAETKLRKLNIAHGWCYIHNGDFSGVSRIILCWDANLLNMDCLNVHPQAITCSIDNKETHISFFVTMIYGSNDDDERKLLWENLCGM
ncbi:hypothetical protein ACH5RR_007079 [Cinchona calisaya]|uniref:Uncharacterized protein n=1 Tax=Cinchona calisaya TaxID=153742 RepID=A0ABD3AQS6_9GENT